MECKEVRPLLEAFLEQALTDEESEAVEAHLNQCDGCWQELSEMRALCEELEDPVLQRMVLSEPSPLPADFTAQVMGRIQAEQPTGVHIVWPWLRQKWSRRQVASVAYAMSATMVVVSAGNMLFLWNQTSDRLSIWAAQGQAYWEGFQAYFVGGAGAYLSSIWQWLGHLF